MRDLARRLAAALAASTMASTAFAETACRFDAPPKVLMRQGDDHAPGAKLLRVWEMSDRPVLWSTADPVGYGTFRAAVKRHVPDTDPARILAAAPSANNARVAASAAEWVRSARCLQKLLYQRQDQRMPTFTAPTEFAAFVLRSPDGKRLRIYSYTANLDGIGRMDPVSDPVARDHEAGWVVLAGLHNHAFHPGDRPDLNGVVAPSVPDAQFNARFHTVSGMREAWITNGLDTVEIPASAFGSFEGADPPAAGAR